MFPIPWNYPFRKKDGTVVNMEDAGGGGGGGYVLPPATASTLGGIKVGDGLSVEEDGTLSASGGGGGGGTIKVTRYSISSSHATGTDVYLGGDTLANFGMSSDEKLVAVVPSSGHFSHGIQCSTNSSGAGKKFSALVPSDTVFLSADLKYATSSSSPAEVCFIFEST